MFETCLCTRQKTTALSLGDHAGVVAGTFPWVRRSRACPAALIAQICESPASGLTNRRSIPLALQTGSPLLRGTPGIAVRRGLPVSDPAGVMVLMNGEWAADTCTATRPLPTRAAAARPAHAHTSITAAANIVNAASRNTQAPAPSRRERDSPCTVAYNSPVAQCTESELIDQTPFVWRCDQQWAAAAPVKSYRLDGLCQPCGWCLEAGRRDAALPPLAAASPGLSATTRSATTGKGSRPAIDSTAEPRPRSTDGVSGSAPC